MRYEDRHFAAGERYVGEVVAGDKHELLVTESHLPSVALIYIDAAEELASLGVQRAHALRDLQSVADHLVVLAIDDVVNGVSGDQQVLLKNQVGRKTVRILKDTKKVQFEMH